MMNISKLAVVSMLAVSAAVGQGSAARPPLSFRGFAPAMSFDSFQKAYAARRELEKKELAKFDGYLDCHQIAPTIQRCMDPTDGLSAEFVDEKLSELSWTFSHDEFENIRDGLVAKFGPGRAQRGQVQNRMGAVFDDESRQWGTGVVIMKIEEHAGQLDESNLTLTDRKLNSEFVKRLPVTSPDI